MAFSIRYDVETGRVNLISNSDEQPHVDGMAWLTVEERPHFEDGKENLYVEDGQIVRRPTGDPPPAVIMVYEISNRQFWHALALMHEITRPEALAAVRGTIPPRFAEIVEHMPEDQKFAAEMLLSGATTFERAHPLVEKLGEAMGWTHEEINALWVLAGSL